MTITVVFPYWQRQAALDRTLASYREHYAAMDLEIVIVDDGSPEPATVPQSLPWPVVVERLPAKDNPLNPCVPINRGAAKTSHVLVLTNPEVTHPTPVFPEMYRQLLELGPSGYVMAAAWCPERGEWHCHSNVTTPQRQGIPQPEGAGLHFCAMLQRNLWERSGGFDEAYRQGAGYEDNDFVLRLARAGARFRIGDDLVVHHHKTGAVTQWLPGQHDRNRALFFQKWTN